MQNTIPQFRQSSIVFEKPGILPENLKKLWRAPTIPIFFAETSHTFCTHQYLQKGVWDFFILFRSRVISKN